MAVVALSVGGSVIGELNFSYIKNLAAILKSSKHKVYVVVGGGEPARKYIELCRKFGIDESFLDEVGIDVSRLNARVLISALGLVAYPKPAKDLDEASLAGKSYNIVVMGGTHPGHTTDAVTTMLAERVKADRIIIATNVAGVYTADPKKVKTAKLIKKLTPKELTKIVIGTEAKAGAAGVIDPLASKIIERAGIPTFVLNGNDLESLRNAVEGKKFVGTRIVA